MPHFEDVTLPAGNVKRIHINTASVRRCVREQTDEPCVIVRTSRGTYYGRDIEIRGASRLVQSLQKPMPGCGARIWIESHAEVCVLQAVRAVEESCPVEVAA